MRRSDLALCACFALFAFTSLVMEPYVVWGLDYHRAGDPFAAGWLLYATRWDPAFLEPPLFLRIMCGIDLFIFGPFYLVLIYAFIKQKNWIRIPALLQSTALIYSTVEYFAFEFIGERSRADILMVIVCNIPYTVVPLLLMFRMRGTVPFQAAAAEKGCTRPESALTSS
jgi:hypothetical protein